MQNEQLVSQLVEKFGAQAEKVELNPAQPALVVDKSILVEFLKQIKEDENFKIDYLSCISAVDYLENGMEMNYHLCSIELRYKLTVKVKLDREKPEVPTIREIHPGADWHEREAWELFGIDIKGHPNLKTLLLPEDWKDGWPMRRDWEGNDDFVKMPEF
ncbi:MAG TPA: NADH-quinone oxidoreductase subunit C [candidate division Zixibacteria bacterium]|nr:NADH-quinone oxidoreductase subunit C [candidate division Zixibacteria bacterium]HEQ99974.1 NADH-quinone oxidoreductase subunit C [candidate division Zixibacteria bacterium]